MLKLILQNGKFRKKKLLERKQLKFYSIPAHGISHAN